MNNLNIGYIYDLLRLNLCTIILETHGFFL